MSDMTQDEVISKVSSIFDVKDVIINTNDIQFKIEDTDFKNKFAFDKEFIPLKITKSKFFEFTKSIIFPLLSKKK